MQEIVWVVAFKACVVQWKSENISNRKPVSCNRQSSIDCICVACVVQEIMYLWHARLVSCRLLKVFGKLNSCLARV